MMTPRPRPAILAVLLLGIFLLHTPSAALNIGRRRISCTTLRNTDAVLDPNYNLPNLAFFAGAQAVLPSLAKCPEELMYQAPWFEGSGPGFCPVAYWSLPALVPGLVLFAAAAAMRRYASTNRLVVGTDSLGTAKVEDGEVVDEAPLVDFRDVEDWSVGPAGLSVRRRDGEGGASSSLFVPPFWNAKDVEALLEERIGG